jgi:DNA-binding CsgD family transcriptional regulator
MATALRDPLEQEMQALGRAARAAAQALALAPRAAKDQALLAAAAALRERTGGPVMVADRGYYEQIVQRARQQLSPATFTSLWDEARALPLADVVAEALTLADEPVTPDELRTVAIDRASDVDDGSRVFSGLSLREREVLHLIAAGHSNAEVAQMLFISPRTVSTHAAHILGKLGLTTRAELIAFAHREGFA